METTLARYLPATITDSYELVDWRESSKLTTAPLKAIRSLRLNKEDATVHM